MYVSTYVHHRSTCQLRNNDHKTRYGPGERDIRIHILTWLWEVTEAPETSRPLVSTTAVIIALLSHQRVLTIALIIAVESRHSFGDVLAGVVIREEDAHHPRRIEKGNVHFHVTVNGKFQGRNARAQTC